MRMKENEEIEQKIISAMRIDGFVAMSKVAKYLNIPKMGRNKIFAVLRQKEILDDRNIPDQQYIDEGYFIVWGRVIAWTTGVSWKGIEFIRETIMSELQ